MNFLSKAKGDDLDDMLPSSMKKNSKKKESKGGSDSVISIANGLKDADVRHSCYITTDKQKYKPGETVRIRAVFLNSFTHKPCQKLLENTKLTFQIKSADGTTVVGGEDVKLPDPQHSVSSIYWTIPKTQAGGQYSIHIEQQQYPPIDELIKSDDSKDGGGEETPIVFQYDRKTASNVTVKGMSLHKTGKRNMWDNLVRIPLNMKNKVHKFKFSVDKSHGGGIYVGFAAKNTKKHNQQSFCFGVPGGTPNWHNPTAGNSYEIVCDTKKDVIEVFRNNVKLCVNTKKPSELKPEFFNVHLYYKGDKITFEGKSGFIAPAVRKFDIETYSVPKFKMDIEFIRKGYGIGDTVKARLKVERSEGGFPQKGVTEATARVDGKEVFRKGNIKIDPSNGLCFVSFKLPDEIKEGIGTLSFAVTEGITENTSKTIPIILKKLNCVLYPECGDLVYGINNGVYFEAKTLTNDPADFHGLIYARDMKDKKSKIVKLIKTQHEGRGYFDVKPEKGFEYYINVIKPEGVTVPIEFPKIKESGLSMMIKNKTVSNEFGKDIEVILNTTEEVTVKIGLFKKEKNLFWTDLLKLLPDKENVIKISPKVQVDGVVRLTLFYLNPWFGVDKLDYPIAERLLFIKPPKELEFKIKSNKKEYTPGESVELTVETCIKGTNVNVDSTIGVSIVDDAVIKMTTKRKRAPRLLEQVYFEEEVLELKDPEAYFYPKNEKGIEFTPADVARDLLLGTQGWRRFIYKYFSKNKLFFKTEKKYLNVDKNQLFRILNIPDPDKRVVETIPKPPAPDWESESDDDSDDDSWSTMSRVRTRSYGGRKVKKKKSVKRGFKLGGGGGRGGGRGRARGRAPPRRAMMKNSGLLGAIRQSKPLRSVSRSSSSKKDGSSGLMNMLQQSIGSRRSEMKVMEEKSKKRLLPSRPMMKKERRKRVEREQQPEQNLSLQFDDEEEEEEVDELYDMRAKRVWGGKRRKPYPIIHEVVAREPEYKTISYAIEYAHKTRKGKKPNERDDFVECVYFAPYINVSKKHKIKFDLNDSITTFCVFIDGWTKSGILGHSKEFMIVSKKAFYCTPKMPLEISFKDEIKMPVQIVNNLQKGITVDIDCTTSSKDIINIITKKKGNEKIKGESRVVKYFDFNVKSSYVDEEMNYISINSKVKEFSLSDNVKKGIVVKPYGFPIFFNFSGNLKAKKSIEYEIKIPDDYVANSIETEAFIIPTNLASFESSLKGLIKEPYGCFEQVSSTMYPMIMAINYFNNNEQDLDTQLYNKIDKHMTSGYKKLKAYECKGKGGLFGGNSTRGGFDWYGRNPPNESLTAMGLVQFIELAKVFPVDRNIIERTKKWLLSRRTDKGFKRNSGRYAYGHAPDATVNAYIIWSMSNSGIAFNEIEKQITSLKNEVAKSRNDDCYVIGLLALAYYNYGKENESKELVKRIIQHQTSNGSITKASSTITRSGGDNKALECTAIACLAWMNFKNEFSECVDKGMDFILKRNKAGRYGATQSTVLCIKAVIKYFLNDDTDGDSNGPIELLVNDVVCSTLNVKKSDSKMMLFDDFRRNLKWGKGDAGKNRIKINSKIAKSMPFSVVVACKVSTPPSNIESLPFTFENKLLNQKIKEGDITEVHVKLTNKSKTEPVPMCIARVGLPAGLTVRVEKLKELQKLGKFEYYELFGPREVVFYWYGIKANDSYDFNVEVIASTPGKYIGDCSRAYEYYNDDIKYYVEGLQCEIIPKNKN